MIICASRRTDIPAFHSEWMMNRLRAGYVLVRNPVYNNLVYRISLARRDVDCILFMTKDPRLMIPHLREVGSMGHMYTFQVTITPYGHDIEPNVPFKADISDACREISDRIGRDRILWRYDPVVFNNSMGIEYHRRKFDMMCREASEWTDRCTFSFLDTYGKLSRFQEAGILRPVTKPEMDAFAKMASKTAEEYGITLSYCCAKYDLSRYGISPRGCIDREMMLSLNIPYETSSSPLRDGCRCVKNIDIGEYDTCMHDCLYCYANKVDPSRRISKVYDPNAEMLYGSLNPRDTVTELGGRDTSRLSDFI